MIGRRSRSPEMHPAIALIPIDRDGRVAIASIGLTPLVGEVLAATGNMYANTGYEEPWIGYLAIAEDVPVGTCGFKGSPSDGRVEIAYFTFPSFEGRGVATAMAAQLIAFATGHPSRPAVAAQTLPQRDASHRILEKLGFKHTQTLQHPEDGAVWEWRLQL